MTKIQITETRVLDFGHSDFEFISDFVLRIYFDI